MDNSEAIANFCSITGCVAHVAEHYLSACNWDLNRSLEFYLETPPDAAGPGAAADTPRSREASPPRRDPAPERAPVSGPAPRPYEDVGMAGDDDADLQAALAASMNPSSASAPAAAAAAAAGSSRPPAPGPTRPSYVTFPDDDDDGDLPGEEEDFAQAMARQRASAQAASRAAAAAFEEAARSSLGVLGRGLPVRAARADAGTATDAAATAGRAAHTRFDAMDDDMDDDWVPPAAMRFGSAGGGGGGRPPHADLHLPEGFSSAEVEEARMLEAALLGVPYEGRMPDFAAASASAAAAAADPTRMLRAEQDRAYEESLAADRARAESAAAAARAAEEAERQKAEAEEAERQSVQEAERALQAQLQRKQHVLPPEPAASDPAAITIVVRMPDGSRQSRRFAKSTPLRAVFDFVDVQSGGQVLKPGSYSLVAQFPRKLYTEACTETLEQAGCTRDSAFFVEANK